MKKLMKILVGTIVTLLAAAVLLLLTLPLWLGTIARPGIPPVVSSVADVDFRLDRLYLNPYTGRFEVGGLVLGNPKGYDEPVALSLSNLVIDAAMTTLGDKCVHIEEVTVEGLFVSYVNGGQYKVDNFTQIQYNVAGGKEKFEADKAKAEEKKAEEKAAAVPDKPVEAKKDGSEKKLVIDLLTIRNVRIKLGFVTIPVPVDIVLKDLGKESDGLTFSELCEEVWKAILGSANAIGDGVKALGGLLQGGAGQLGEGASKAVDAIGAGASKALDAIGGGASKTVDAIGGGASKTVDAVGGGASKTVDAVGDGASKAMDVIGGGASKTVDAVGEGASKAVDAVGDGASKAVNAFKGLFN